MSTHPEWFQYIRVRQRTILGSRLPPDYLISFGPLNICTPRPTEKRAEHLLEGIRNWLWMFMEKDLCAKDREIKERDAEIARLRAIQDRSVEWWLREGKEQFSGAPEWVFAARDGKP